jgi:hypothetical protein
MGLQNGKLAKKSKYLIKANYDYAGVSTKGRPTEAFIKVEGERTCRCPQDSKNATTTMSRGS